MHNHTNMDCTNTNQGNHTLNSFFIALTSSKSWILLYAFCCYESSKIVQKIGNRQEWPSCALRAMEGRRVIVLRNQVIREQEAGIVDKNVNNEYRTPNIQCRSKIATALRASQ